MLKLDTNDSRPIWRQIEEGFAQLVASGALGSGSAIPSVRELARELAVNPATVAKAYQRLTDRGLFAVRRGEGTFVAASLPRLSTRERERQLAAGARRFAALARSLRVELPEARGALAAAWEQALPRPEEETAND